jgi:hypothetical protein
MRAQSVPANFTKKGKSLALSIVGYYSYYIVGKIINRDLPFSTIAIFVNLCEIGLSLL